MEHARMVSMRKITFQTAVCVCLRHRNERFFFIRRYKLPNSIYRLLSDVSHVRVDGWLPQTKMNTFWSIFALLIVTHTHRIPSMIFHHRKCQRKWYILVTHLSHFPSVSIAKFPKFHFPFDVSMWERRKGIQLCSPTEYAEPYKLNEHDRWAWVVEQQ